MEITEDTHIIDKWRRYHNQNKSAKDEIMLYGCNGNEQPEHCNNPAVKYVGAIPIDLTKVNVDKSESKWIKGKKVYRIRYSVEIIPAGKAGVLTFRIIHDGRELGTTELKCDTL